MALRAFLRDRLVVRGEIALRVVGAAVKHVAAASLLLRNVALATLRAGDADGVLLDVLTLRIAAAGHKLAKPAVPQNQVMFPTLRAHLLERLWRFLLFF